MRKLIHHYQKLVSERNAALCIMTILGVMLLFHLAVISGVIPYAIVWGGRLSSHKEMVRFETVSITVNVFIMLLTSNRGGFANLPLPTPLSRIAFAVLTLLFLANTLGNLAATNRWETILFTPITFLLALLCFRLALPGTHNSSITGQKA